MHAGTDAVPAKEHDPEEPRLKEEGGQDFISQQRAGNTAGKLGETAPVSAELVGHHQTGDDAHAEVNGENL